MYLIQCKYPEFSDMGSRKLKALASELVRPGFDSRWCQKLSPEYITCSKKCGVKKALVMVNLSPLIYAVIL